MSSSYIQGFEEGISFNLTTQYFGNAINLQAISNKDRFTIVYNSKTVGHLKLGKVQHSWYTVDDSFNAIYLVDEIGNKIQARLLNNN